MILRGAVLAEKLPQFLALVSEILTQPAFPEREIRKLKSETISEILEEIGDDSSLAARRSALWVRPRNPSATTTRVAWVRSTISAT